MKTGNMVRFREVDSALGGAPVDEALASSFEAACSEFSSLAQSRTGESQEQLEEIAKLLSVSEKNLEEVKNQKWFQRAWRTVSGHNRKLRNVNEQNMLRVQKGAVYFLQNLAENNQVLMKSVHQALKRVEGLQVDNLRLKGYLVRLGRKFSDRIAVVEERLESVEETVAVGHTGPAIDARALIVANILLVLCVVLLLTASGGYGVRVLCGILFAASLAGFALSFRTHLVRVVRRPSPPQRTNEDDRRKGRIRRHNRKLLPEVKGLLGQGVLTSCEESVESLAEPVYSRFEPILEHHDDDDDDDDMDEEEYADFMESVISTSFSIRREVEARCAEAASFCQERLDGTASHIAETHLDNTVLHDLEAQVDAKGSDLLEKRLAEILHPVVTQAEAVERKLRKMRPDFPRFRKYFTESFASSAGRNFVKGLLIIPLLMDDEEEFTTEFRGKWESVVDKLTTLTEMLEESVLQQARHAVESHVDDYVHHMAPIFDAFSDQGVSMASLRDDLRKAIRE